MKNQDLGGQKSRVLYFSFILSLYKNYHNKSTLKLRNSWAAKNLLDINKLMFEPFLFIEKLWNICYKVSFDKGKINLEKLRESGVQPKFQEFEIDTLKDEVIDLFEEIFGLARIGGIKEDYLKQFDINDEDVNKEMEETGDHKLSAKRMEELKATKLGPFVDEGDNLTWSFVESFMMGYLGYHLTRKGGKPIISESFDTQ